MDQIGLYLYVVLLVTRTHHAVVYDIPTAAAPENAIANKRKFRVSGGLFPTVLRGHKKGIKDIDAQVT